MKMRFVFTLIWFSILLYSCFQEFKYNLYGSVIIYAHDEDFTCYYKFEENLPIDFTIIFPVNGVWQVQSEGPNDCGLTVQPGPAWLTSNVDSWFNLNSQTSISTGKRVYCNMSFYADTIYRFELWNKGGLPKTQYIHFVKKKTNVPHYEEVGFVHRNDTLTLPKVKIILKDNLLNEDQ